MQERRAYLTQGAAYIWRLWGLLDSVRADGVRDEASLEGPQLIPASNRHDLLSPNLNDLLENLQKVPNKHQTNTFQRRCV
jgi:hypothetical protein